MRASTRGFEIDARGDPDQPCALSLTVREAHGLVPAVSSQAARRILWVALLVALPLPFWVMEGGWVPAIWLYELAGFTLAVLFTEGGSIVALISALFTLEALLATGVAYGLARWTVKILDAWTSGAVRTAGIVGIVVGLVLLAFAGVYSTAFVADGRPVNLLELLV